MSEWRKMPIQPDQFTNGPPPPTVDVTTSFMTSWVGLLFVVFIACMSGASLAFGLTAFIQNSSTPVGLTITDVNGIITTRLDSLSQPNITALAGLLETLITNHVDTTHTTNITYPSDIVANTITATTEDYDSIVGFNGRFRGDLYVEGNIQANTGPNAIISNFLEVVASYRLVSSGNIIANNAIIAITGNILNNLTVGSVNCLGTVTTNAINVVSTMNVKTDITPLNVSSSVERIKAIQLFSYRHKSTYAQFSGQDPTQLMSGFISEQLYTVTPTYTKMGIIQSGVRNVMVGNLTTQEAITEPALAADHGRILPDVVGTVQYLLAKVEALEARIAALGG